MYKFMRISLSLVGVVLASALCVSCTSHTNSYLIDVADLPLKSISIPGTDWSETPLRAHARYMLDHAESNKEKLARRGDYFFVNWHDITPTKHTEIRFYYTQSLTGSQVLSNRVLYNTPRASSQKREEKFFFTGDERQKKGDILSWRVELIVEGELKGHLQSFLWE